MVGEDPDLLERAWIEKAVDTLARGQLAPLVLPADPLLAPHLTGDLAAALDLFDLGLPAHDGGAVAIMPAFSRAATRASGYPRRSTRT
jgi:hypothetical protein